MWFDSWGDVARVLVVGTAAYLSVVVVLRVSGKRTLAKLNAFDLVVTVALGSTLATILLTRDVSWSEGVAALALLAAAQFAVAWVSARAQRLRDAVTAKPTLLLWQGRLLEDHLQAQRVSVSEVRQAVRSSGTGGLSGVAAVVLESDGTLSVISSSAFGDGTALSDVPGVEQQR